MLKNKLFNSLALNGIAKNVVFALCLCSVAQGAAFCAATNGSPSLKHTAFKFLMAMAGVVISSVVIFVGLTLYNKFIVRRKSINNGDYANSLESPKTLKDAINLFLEKTKWD